MKWYLDFGHGGKDFGVLGNTLKESDTVLKIGTIIKNILRENNQAVITTRFDDRYYSLDYRISKANNNECDYFISLHMNTSEDNSTRGCKAWVYDDNSKLYNLGNNICMRLSNVIDTPNLGVEANKNFYLTEKTKMPTLIIIIDFLSNRDVEFFLSDYDNLYKISKCISDCLLSFSNQTNSDKLYKVCIGTFNNKSNAIELKNKALSKGFVHTDII
ncbi:MAG: N-acetylmuramoyl-L-alanine amidase family protein [Peptostreptococcaceae bacterium]